MSPCRTAKLTDKHNHKTFARKNYVNPKNFTPGKSKISSQRTTDYNCFYFHCGLNHCSDAAKRTADAVRTKKGPKVSGLTNFLR